MASNNLILCRRLLPSIFPSIRVFSNEPVLHIRWPKYWSFSINPSSEYSGLVSFRIDWFDLLLQSEGLSIVFSNTTVQKHHLSPQLSKWSNSYIHTWLLEKLLSLTRQTFVGKVMSLLFDILSRLFIDFLPRIKCLLIVIASVTICNNFRVQKNKSLSLGSLCRKNVLGTTSVYSQIFSISQFRKVCFIYFQS